MTAEEKSALAQIQRLGEAISLTEQLDDTQAKVLLDLVKELKKQEAKNNVPD